MLKYLAGAVIVIALFVGSITFVASQEDGNPGENQRAYCEKISTYSDAPSSPIVLSKGGDCQELLP
jgi:hypothetical protein